jgi:transcription initiation factor TFIIB
MDDLDSLFNTLSELTSQKDTTSCCDKSDNYCLQSKITICKVCNQTISNLSSGAEWRYYGAEDNKSSDPTRCGMPINELLPNSSVGTVVSKNVKNSNIYKVERFQKWNGMTYKERSKLKIFNHIKEHCQKNNLPMIIIKEANSLYSLCSESRITRGNNKKGLIAACVYYACKNCKVPRSSKEIASIFEIKSVLVTKGVKYIQEILQLMDNNKRIEKINIINQNDFIERFCNKLNLTDYQTKGIQQISDNTKKYNIISENTPPSIAAGCIYMYCLENKIPINKKQISFACNISEVTINKCYCKIKSKIDLLTL